MLERLAIGGMAEVWLAKAMGAAGFEKVVAVKRILPNIAEDNEFITMFQDEARIAGQLAHANVAQILELGKISQSYFISMEYVPGVDVRTLWERVRTRGGFPLSLACYIVSRICEGLDYAHRRKDARGKPLGIIHRDVSPQNILCSYDGDVKIIDFGIAKAASRSTRTQTGILKGKFAYMAPEQARGQAMDHRADIFAIGVILHELITGERLFRADSDFSLLEKVRKAEVQTPRAVRPDTPAELEKVVMRALAARPEDRYPYASNMQADLERFMVANRRNSRREDLAQFVRDHFPENHKAEQARQKAAQEAALPQELTGENSAPGKPKGEGTTLFETGEVEVLTSSELAMPEVSASQALPADHNEGTSPFEDDDFNDATAVGESSGLSGLDAARFATRPALPRLQDDEEEDSGAAFHENARSTKVEEPVTIPPEAPPRPGQPRKGRTAAVEVVKPPEDPQRSRSGSSVPDRRGAPPVVRPASAKVQPPPPVDDSLPTDPRMARPDASEGLGGATGTEDRGGFLDAPSTGVDEPRPAARRVATALQAERVSTTVDARPVLDLEEENTAPPTVSLKSPDRAPTRASEKRAEPRPRSEERPEPRAKAEERPEPRAKAEERPEPRAKAEERDARKPSDERNDVRSKSEERRGPDERPARPATSLANRAPVMSGASIPVEARAPVREMSRAAPPLEDQPTHDGESLDTLPPVRVAMQPRQNGASMSRMEALAPPPPGATTDESSLPTAIRAELSEPQALVDAPTAEPLVATPPPPPSPVERVQVRSSEQSIHSASTRPKAEVLRDRGGGGALKVAVGLVLGLSIGAGSVVGLLFTPVLGRGALVVTGGDETTQVTVDDRAALAGSVVARMLPVGSHKVTVTRDGFQPDIRQVDIRPLEITNVIFSGTAAKGTLRIITNPPGATVTLDGRRLPGVTPILDMEVPPVGQHDVLLKHPDSLESKFSVAVEEGKPFEIKRDLVFPATRVTLELEPADAAIMEGKEYRGNKPSLKVKKDTRAVYKVMRPGCDTAELEIASKGEYARAQKVALKCAAFDAELSINTPPGAGFSVDGIETGLSVPLEGYKLPSGNHRFAVTTKGKVQEWVDRVVPGPQTITPVK